MLRGPTHHLLQMLGVGIDRSPNPRPFRRKGDTQRAKRSVDITKGRRFGSLAKFGGWRVLPFGQPVNLIIENDDRQIDIASHHMQEMVTADAQRITVARDNPNVQIGP